MAAYSSLRLARDETWAYCGRMFSSDQWPSTRAALIALVLLGQVVLGLPKPSVLTEASLRKPKARIELRGWSQGLQSIGLQVTEDQAAEWAIAFSTTTHDLAARIQRPLRPLRRVLGIGQSWALFAAPDTVPRRLYLSAQRADGSWHPVYVPHHPEHDLLKPVLRFRRVRGVHDTLNTAGPTRDALTRWLCTRVLDQNPDWIAVELRVEQRPTAMPGEPQERTPHVRFREQCSRDEGTP